MTFLPPPRDNVRILTVIAVLFFLPLITFAQTTPGELEVTATHVKAPSDTIPRFCASPTISSVKNGAWSDPTTWSLNRLPTTGDKVGIGAGTSVTYDVESEAALDCIEVNGTLAFSTTKNTRLTVADLMIMPAPGTLTIGTAQNPIPAAVKAEIVFPDAPLKTGVVGNPGIDPKQYGNGLIAFGNVTMHGAVKNPTFVRLGQEPKAGQTTFTLHQAPTGWRVGDEVVLPDTRTVGQSDGGMDQDERFIITAINGTQLTMTSPLKYDHLCARDGDGTTITTLVNGEKLCPHLGNVTRNIILRSANPAGVRGHTIYLHRANLDVRYVQFKDLGRTRAFALDNATFDAQGQLTKVGTNQIGRYAFHMHHLWGPRNSSNTGYQGKVIGNAIDGATKWNMTVHNTHYILIQDNVVHDGEGAGIAAEDGRESYNEFIHNFSLNFSGGEKTRVNGLDGIDGDPFWMAGTNNTFRDNVAASGARLDPQKRFTAHGYAAWGKASLTWPNFTYPKIRGANMANPTETTQVSFWTDGTPFVEFKGNELYGRIQTGITITDTGPHAIQELRAWRVNNSVARIYDTQALIDGFIVRESGTGLEMATSARPSIVRHADIQNTKVGIAEFNASLVVEDSNLRNSTNVFIAPPSTPSVQVVAQHMILRRTTFAAPSNSSRPYIAIDANFNGHPFNPTITTFPAVLRANTIFIDDYNKEPGQDFQVYFKEQHPNFKLPAHENKQICADQDFTNQQCWDKYGAAVFGAVASCTDETSHPEINGITCPLAAQVASATTDFLGKGGTYGFSWQINPSVVNSTVSSPTMTFWYRVFNKVLEAHHVILQIDKEPEATTPIGAPNQGAYYLNNVSLPISTVAEGPHILKGHVARADNSKIYGTEFFIPFQSVGGTPTLPTSPPKLTVITPA
ncbi:MAG: G8 domain-containing protein, partial [Candidatus Andersenbacteria bacterium]